MRVDNLGGVGTRLLLAWIGVEEPPLGFVERTVRRFPQFRSARSPGDHPTQFKIYSYAEYSVAAFPESLVGSLFKENGLRNSGATYPRWLRAVSLPINLFVERELCAEFQLLESLCDVIAGAAGGCSIAACREKVVGTVDILISSASCVSCVGAVRQFQLLWPAMHVSVGMMCRGRARGAEVQ